ncbi:MAG: hypothetical protein ABIK61_05725 [candidate division WOR-3 bacterium]
MNQELATVVKLYCTGTHTDLSTYLIGKSKDTLIAILVDLLTMYINDKNSSTLREYVTVTLAGYNHKERKIGYNGFKQDTYADGRTIYCEAKPKNLDTEEFENFKKGQRKTQPTKLNGGGNFSDYTPTRLEKDKKEKDLNMLISGFIDGRLIYIIEFPFNYKDFVENLENQIHRWQEKLKGSKSVKGQFLRSATFNYKNYINCPDLRIVFLLPRGEIERYKIYFDEGFYKFLLHKTQ